MTSHRTPLVLLAAATTLVIAVLTATPAQAASITARSLLWKVSVAAESNRSYERSKVGDWIDANGDCQNTRHDVLITESTVTPTYSSRCTVTRGKWLSRWDNITWTNPADVDIDHHVALAEAWGSGARSWTSSDRKRYANDLYGPALNPMTDNLNSPSRPATPPKGSLPTQPADAPTPSGGSR